MSVARWVRRLGPSPTPDSVTLLCFPYAGAGASVFRPWPASLPANLDVWAVQPPGREDRLREPPQRSLWAVRDAVLEAFEPRGPYALFGHSLGAYVALEVARSLELRGGPAPIRLFVSGASAPDVRRRDLALSELGDAELMRELRRLRGTPEAVLADAELMSLLMPVIRADSAIYETYEPPAGELRCDVFAVGGADDPRVPSSHLDAWSGWTRGRFRRHVLPGDHFFLQASRAELLTLISRELAST